MPQIKIILIFFHSFGGIFLIIWITSVNKYHKDPWPHKSYILECIKDTINNNQENTKPWSRLKCYKSNSTEKTVEQDKGWSDERREGEDGPGGSVNRTARAGQQASPWRAELNKSLTLDGGGRWGRVTCGCLGKLGQGRQAAPAMPLAVHWKKSQAATVAEPGKQEKEGQEEMRPQGSGLIVRDPEATMGTLALSLRQQRREGTARKDEIIDLLKRIVLAALLKWRHIRAGG